MCSSLLVILLLSQVMSWSYWPPSYTCGTRRVTILEIGQWTPGAQILLFMIGSLPRTFQVVMFPFGRNTLHNLRLKLRNYTRNDYAFCAPSAHMESEWGIWPLLNSGQSTLDWSVPPWADASIIRLTKTSSEQITNSSAEPCYFDLSAQQNSQ